MQEIWHKIIEIGTVYGTKIVGAILILVLGRIVIGFIVRALKRLMDRSGTDQTLEKFLLAITRIGLLTFIIIAAISTLGVQTASFIAVIGAAGLAVGFALQGSLANFASGVMLIIFRPFKVGDYVEAGGSAGTVEEIHIFNTILKSPDNRKIFIPNSQVTGGNITNYSAKDTRRVDMVFGIGYDDDIKKAKEILEEIVNSDPRVLKDPAPTIAVSELGDSSVNFVVRPWVKTSDYWSVYFDTHEKVKLNFDQKGVSIPFPQTDVHLYQAETATK
jgi:small conductance mechanosensitive channel